MMKIFLFLCISIVPIATRAASENLHLLISQSPYVPLEEEERLKLVAEATHAATAKEYCKHESSAQHNDAFNKLFPDNGPWDQSGNPIKSCCVNANKKTCCTILKLYDVCFGAGFLAAVAVGFTGILSLDGNPSDTCGSVGGDMLFGAIGSGACVAFTYPFFGERCNYCALNYLSNPDNWNTEKEEQFDKPQSLEMREHM